MRRWLHEFYLALTIAQLAVIATALTHVARQWTATLAADARPRRGWPTALAAVFYAAMFVLGGFVHSYNASADASTSEEWDSRGTDIAFNVLIGVSYFVFVVPGRISRLRGHRLSHRLRRRTEIMATKKPMAEPFFLNLFGAREPLWMCLA